MIPGWLEVRRADDPAQEQLSRRPEPPGSCFQWGEVREDASAAAGSQQIL